MSCLAASCGHTLSPAPRPSEPPADRTELAVVGPSFGPPGGGLPFRRFIADRGIMHGYLYNGDDLFPKQVNLCARGRSALLDLDLGPGASHDLGLLGPAWDAHLTAVALSRDPARPLEGTHRTRFLYAWPAVSTAQLDRLREAHALGRAALVGGARWKAAGPLRRRTGFDAVLPLLPAPAGSPQVPAQDLHRAMARDWARNLMGALLERLSFSVAALPSAALGLASHGRPAYEALVAPYFALTDASEALLHRFLGILEAAALQAGTLFDSRHFLAFHDTVLLADLGPGWRHGRVSGDQLQAIIDHLEPEVARSNEARLRGLLGMARREHARLSYVKEGKEIPGLDEARRHHGSDKLRRDHLAYQALKRATDEARARLSALARRTFTPRIRRRLHRALKAGRDPLVAGSFYFETEHLLETTSGYTHAGIIKRLEDPDDGVAKLWMFDRVLGFHYAYPVAKLANSVPVEVLALSLATHGGRRYHWLRLRIPRRFLIGGGQVSDRVTLQNLFTHLKERLGPCPALATQPGFYYSAISWITAHPMNRLVLADLWTPRTHTGYGYRTLHPERLQDLKGRLLYVPVRLTKGARWTAACPPRLPGPWIQP